ncbi:hypothetical protein BaRGS_00026368, partial [Batillaria attramentaria]
MAFFHLANNEERPQGDHPDKLYKVRPLFDPLADAFTAAYTPQQDLSIDESMVPWRGRLSFRMFIPSKPTRAREGLPASLHPNTVKLKKGESMFRRKDNLLCYRFKDKKKDIFLMSTAHNATDSVAVGTDRQGNPRRKPKLVDDYNHHMKGVDNFDQHLAYYSFHRKTVKWWKRVAMHMIHLAKVQCFLLYKMSVDKPKGQYEFTLDLVECLTIAVPRLEAPAPAPMRSERLSAKDVGHWCTKIPVTGNKSRPTRVCIACSIRGENMQGQAGYQRRKETRFQCVKCDVGLCQEPCFELYHTRVDFKAAVAEAKSQAQDLSDTVAECSRRQLEDIWESLRSICTRALLDTDEADAGDNDGKQKQHFTFLECVVTMATATIHQKNISIPQALIDTAAILHGVLPSLPEEADGVKCRLAQLFEAWWRLKLEGWEDVIPNTILYLLERSLRPKAAAVDVKAVWRLHSVLPLISFDVGSATELRNLLGQCCSSFQFLKTDEGRRFLGYVFTLNTSLVDCLHKAIKNQIPFAPKTWMPLYGDVYFRAWQKATGDTQKKIEVDCIQDLMNHAIHASRAGRQPLSASLFRVLNYLHHQKKQRGVDSMLLRLYDPILWRSLSVPNTVVRANSASLLLDAFPLQNPDSTAEEIDFLMQKQFDFLQRLLNDPCPNVRSVMGEGVCRLISEYLDMVPIEVVQAILKKLLTEIVLDAASPTVRLAVIKGITAMLDNPMCHPPLKPLLPQLSHCLHDNAETVRLAMMQLLLKVKGIRTIKYWDIAPIEHLLARLELDSQPVVRRIVELLFPSFFPLNQTPQEQVSRCVTLIESNLSAARVFFLHAPRHMTLTDTVKYMALLCRYVLESVRSAGQAVNTSTEAPKRSKTRQSKRKRKETPQPENSELKQSIMKKLSITIPEVIKVTQDPMVIHGCLSKLRKMPGGSEAGDYTEMLEAMCLWQRAPDVLQLISDWLEHSLTPTELSPAPETKKGKGGKKCVQIMAPDSEKRPGLALDYLAAMLKSAVCKRILMEHHRPQLVLLNRLLSRIMVIIEKQIESGNDGVQGSEDTPDFAERVLSLHLRLSVLLHDDEDKASDCVARMIDVLNWEREILLPAIMKSNMDNSSASHERKGKTVGRLAKKNGMPSACIMVTLKVCSNMMMLGLGDAEFMKLLTEFCEVVLHTADNLSTVDQVLGCLHQMLLFEELQADSVVSKCMSHVMVAIATCTQKQEGIDFKMLTEVRNKLSGIVTCILARQQHQEGTQVATEITGTMLAAVLAELQHASKHDALPRTLEDGQDPLPAVSTSILKCFSRTSASRRLFVGELESCVQSGAVTDPHTAHGAVHLLLVVSSSGQYSKDVDLTQCQSAMSGLVQKLNDQPVTDSDIDPDVW